MMEAADSSETSVHIYKTTRCHVPENGLLHKIILKFEVNFFSKVTRKKDMNLYCNSQYYSPGQLGISKLGFAPPSPPPPGMKPVLRFCTTYRPTGYFNLVNITKEQIYGV
jgi:hypothetical protein